jgi:hypothetical protein
MTSVDRLTPYVVTLDAAIRTGDGLAIREAAVALTGAASVVLDLCLACGVTVAGGASTCTEHKRGTHGA